MGQSHYQSPCHAPREYDAWEGEILSGLLEGDEQHIGDRCQRWAKEREWDAMETMVLWLTQL